ncbi:hypothetical protein GALMADRAFT_138605 [Galerina marginata CBS 339.88]|uniref:GH18 domain-containing protein n=1 Tax=Galerina marginata (strain CBS 339.88) TaxID=685588 RepID=A0A067TEX2_GALM3|nr:hypothetical protein GALMADRAFT_138605 [Galerina marginata CBS 339.88]
MPSLSSPVHRVVVGYDTQFQDKKYISPTPLIPFASHLIVGGFDLTLDNNTEKVVLNDISLDDSSLTKMWIDIARSIKKLLENFTGYYKPVSSCITDRSLDGIDLVLATSDDYKTVVKLIKQLKADFGEEFIITLAPEPNELKGKSGYSGFDYRGLEKNYGAKIDWYNVQFYETLKNTADYEAVVTGCPLDPSRIVAGIHTNSAIGSTFVKLDTIKSTVRKLLKKYGNRFGGVLASDYYKSEPNTDEPWTWAVVMKVAMDNYKEVLALEHINAT